MALSAGSATREHIIKAINDLMTAAGATELAELSDVDDAVAATSGHYLRGDGTDWSNSAIQDADIPSTIARDSEVTTAVSDHSADTTSVHGIADTSALVLTSDARLTDARTPTSHGADKHDDVVRSIFISKTQMEADPSATATSSNFGTSPDGYSAWVCADAATRGVFATVELPADAKASSPVNLVIEWTASLSENSTVVQWSVNANARAHSESLIVAGTTTAFTGISQNRINHTLTQETSTEILASADAGELIRLNVRRLGSDAADTYTGDARIVGLRLTYTAVQ